MTPIPLKYYEIPHAEFSESVKILGSKVSETNYFLDEALYLIYLILNMQFDCCSSHIMYHLIEVARNGFINILKRQRKILCPI